ncbi:MAG: hypothetical protein ACLGI3_17440 [Actinomycetes bacterium]
MSISQRPSQTSCGWCGAAVEQGPAGRLRRYCDRSCRQRAYEVRTAQRRQLADVGVDDAGRRGERVVERLVTAPHPRRVSGWTAALDELADQLADGRIGWWHAEQLRAPLARVHAQVQAATRTQATTTRAVPLAVRFQEPVAPRPAPPVDEHPADPADPRAAVEGRLRGGPVATTLDRLARDLGHPVDVVRQVVLDLEHLGVVVARLRRHVVPVDELTPHAHVELHAVQPLWRR